MIGFTVTLSKLLLPFRGDGRDVKITLHLQNPFCHIKKLPFSMQNPAVLYS